ncbi:hypothetical protein [uncultured Phascolarctobacterium sp.]|nr:hypothetical protein [uncultured Phascolarctobacterium sp.]
MVKQIFIEDVDKAVGSVDKKTPEISGSGRCRQPSSYRQHGQPQF